MDPTEMFREITVRLAEQSTDSFLAQQSLESLNEREIAILDNLTKITKAKYHIAAHPTVPLAPVGTTAP